MALTVEEIEQQIHRLEAADRDRLFRDLVASLDDGPEDDVASLWVDEARRRLAELQSGSAQAVPLADVIRRARTRLTHGD